jgi:hypothetical protein
MPNLQNGEELNQIGQLTADLLGKEPEDVFIFIKAGDNWGEVGVFDNQPDEVIYHDPSSELMDLVIKMWADADPGRKWFMIHYDIKDGRFDAEYFYPDQFGFSFDDPVGDPDDEDDDPGKRDRSSYTLREDALTARYGDKPVRYPPMDEGFHDLTEDDLKRD